MKNITISTIASLSLLVGLLACSDPELPSANLNAPVASYKATFTFANATVDAPSLDFYVNGIKLGTAAPGAGLPLVTQLPIPSSGATGSATANASIRAKATSGTIGGKVGSSDLIYRSTSNGTNNFAAVNGGNYTIIAVDSINRPQPKRLNRNTATISFADVTYWNPNTQSMITASRRDSLNPANCPACINWDGAAQTPSTATEYANLVTVGLVPLGLTDPGGVRYYVVSDVPLTFNAGNVATNAGIRFVNAIANSNGVTAAANTNGTFGGPPIWVRLRPAAGPNITLGSNTNSVVSVAGGFNPTVGSRTTGNLAFTTQAIAAAGVPTSYTLEVSSDAGYATILYSATVSFLPGKNYTVFVRGIVGGTGPKAIGHGILTH